MVQLNSRFASWIIKFAASAIKNNFSLAANSETIADINLILRQSIGYPFHFKASWLRKRSDEKLPFLNLNVNISETKHVVKKKCINGM